MHPITYFLLLPVLTHGLELWGGVTHPDDPALTQHPMYTQAIGVYHRESARNFKFCSNKGAGIYSMGRCKNFHAHCDDHENLTVVSCPVGEIFSNEESTCLVKPDESECQDIQYAEPRLECHSELIGLGDCENRYGVCYKEAYYAAECIAGDSFSEFFGHCVTDSENPSCQYKIESTNHKNDKLFFFGLLLESLCPKDSGVDIDFLLGPCNSKFLYCAKEGYSFLSECKENGQVMEKSNDRCVSESESIGCQQESDFVEKIDTILKSIDFCKSKKNGLYFSSNLYPKCGREIIFCYKEQSSFHLCEPGTGFALDAEGSCKPKDECRDPTTSLEQLQEEFLTDLAIEAQFCPDDQPDRVVSMGNWKNFYGQCNGGKFEIRNCGPGQIFDSECRYPIIEDNFLKIGVHDWFRCLNPETMDELRPYGPCEPHFLICENGIEKKFPCPNDDLAFDENKGVCIPKIDHPECPEYKTETTPKISWIGIVSMDPEPGPIIIVPPPAQTIPKEMTCHGDGELLTHESDCRKFYQCAHGRKVEKSCPPKTAFDPAINVCNHINMVGQCSEQTN